MLSGREEEPISWGNILYESIYITFLEKQTYRNWWIHSGKGLGSREGKDGCGHIKGQKEVSLWWWSCFVSWVWWWIKKPIHDQNWENGIRSPDCINVNILVIIRHYSMAKLGETGTLDLSAEFLTIEHKSIQAYLVLLCFVLLCFVIFTNWRSVEPPRRASPSVLFFNSICSLRICVTFW